MTQYFCVLDFEATCLRDKKILNQEIIQFPSRLYKWEHETLTYVDEFNEYVKPQINPILSEFCINLTGIKQETVDAADSFKHVMRRHYLWLQHHDALSSVTFITVGNWNLETMLPNQLKLVGIRPVKEYCKWLNIKEKFREFYGYKPGGLSDMLTYLKMEFIGHPHNGLDDVRNTSRILERMLADGARLQ